MKHHRNLETLLTHFNNELRASVKARIKTTTEAFIKSYVRSNSFDIDANNELLQDLEKIKLKNKDVKVYTFEDMQRDKNLINNIINDVKHNNYSIWALQKFRRFK